MLLDSVCAIDSHLIISRIAMLNAEVVVLKVDIEIRKDQLLLDEIPDDAGHFIAVEFDNRSLYFDLAHLSTFRVRPYL